MQDTRQIDKRGRFQRGLLSLQQLNEAGTTRGERRTLVGQGVIVPVNHGVFRTVGAPTTWEQDLLAACLAAGPDAVASHRAAAALWDLMDPPVPVEITVPYEHRPLPVKAIRHRTQAFREQDRTVRHGVPVTKPARTLLDLGAVAAHAVPGAVERCLYKRLTTTSGLWRLVDELGGPGRRGTKPLRRALEQRALGDKRPESLLEPLLAGIAAEIGVELEYQHKVEIDGHSYRLDFALPSLMLGFEVDGLSAHGTRDALDSDLERQNRLIQAGWMLLRYTFTHLHKRRRAVRDEIRSTVRQRRALLLQPTLNPDGGSTTLEVQRQPAPL